MSSTLTAAELASMRAEATAVALDRTCAIQRRVAVSDGMGHSTETWPALYTNVPCNLQLPTGGFMQNLADRLSSLTTWIVSLPDATDVRIGDRLAVAGASDILIVQAVYAPQSLSVLMQVMASEIKVV